MARFTVRIQLSDADASDYEELKELMEEVGFSKNITSIDGISYKLPDAEYDYSGRETASEVLDAAYKIAEMVKAKPKVLITKSAERRWKGLSKVNR
ncbi:DUF2622 domain-containing protein [Xenorhabdus sp. Sc-CR9]|uniref:DUF2622 domain-containing protein n=1 Tax=Xenorhabdus sp. Sc-CR9 TaxID=2584468 RepID=UPI001F3CA137|nr:DUF2622 domain-containing protein [Xenorhabdus sp. Sc-CR9]